MVVLMFPYARYVGYACVIWTERFQAWARAWA